MKLQMNNRVLEERIDHLKAENKELEEIIQITENITQLKGKEIYAYLELLKKLRDTDWEAQARKEMCKMFPSTSVKLLELAIAVRTVELIKEELKK